MKFKPQLAVLALAVTAAMQAHAEPAIIYEIGAFHRRDREPSVLAAAFLELLDATLDR